MRSSRSKFSLIHNPNELSPISGFLAMGNFDGVHLGHQLLLEEANKRGDVSVLTYEPHPLISLHKTEEPFLLTTVDEKIFLLERYRVKEIIFLNFRAEISQLGF
ncbi:MAG: adenylyltransferase/cytidyltransferase family protein [candidate division WOR-3 bacterium]